MKRRILRSRRRVGWCEFSARLFFHRPRSRRRSSPSSRAAEPYDRKSSVTNRSGAKACLFHCLAAPETMKGAVVSKAAAELVKLGFAREIHAKPGTPLWRRDETGRSFALKLTAAGLKAIAVDEGPRDAIEPGAASQAQLLLEAKNGVSLDDVGRRAPTAAPRDGSKLALMIDLLRRADGATIVDLTQATGWLAHTTRAAIRSRWPGYQGRSFTGAVALAAGQPVRAPLPRLRGVRRRLFRGIPARRLRTGLGQVRVRRVSENSLQTGNLSGNSSKPRRNQNLDALPSYWTRTIIRSAERKFPKQRNRE